MTYISAQRNRDIVLEAFDTLFNKRDYAAAERFWSPDYIQHSAHIEPGREGLFNLIRSLPDELAHEVGLAMAEGDMVMIRGRFTGHGLPAPWIAVDFVRMEDGLLCEHWDVIEDEVSRENSVSGLPMFGDDFPDDR
jgi:predicted SnoaL-like aldol condensation-catalyzing enzyme